MKRGLIFFFASLFGAPIAPLAGGQEDLNQLTRDADAELCQELCPSGCVDHLKVFNRSSDRMNKWHDQPRAAIEKAARNGDALAQLWLASKRGLDGSTGEQVAGFLEVSRLYRTGLPEAAGVLAQMYHSGWGTNQDLNRAKALFLEALDKGQQWAAGGVGLIKVEQSKGTADLADAVRYLEIGSRSGIGRAKYNLAVVLERSPPPIGDSLRARRLLREAAAGGDPKAREGLAWMLLEHEYETSIDEAWLNATQAFCDGAKTSAGPMFAAALARKDYQNAYLVARASAAHGDAGGFQNLYRISAVRGDFFNPRIAIAAARKAFDLNPNDGNMYNLGQALGYFGENPDDVRLGIEYLERAANRGLAAAATQLASFFIGESKVGRDEKKFLFWRKRALDLGDQSAARLVFNRRDAEG